VGLGSGGQAGPSRPRQARVTWSTNPSVRCVRQVQQNGHGSGHPFVRRQGSSLRPDLRFWRRSSRSRRNEATKAASTHVQSYGRGSRHGKLQNAKPSLLNQPPRRTRANACRAASSLRWPPIMAFRPIPTERTGGYGPNGIHVMPTRISRPDSGGLSFRPRLGFSHRNRR
jgi:hypothetical protein